MQRINHPKFCAKSHPGRRRSHAHSLFSIGNFLLSLFFQKYACTGLVSTCCAAPFFACRAFTIINHRTFVAYFSSPSALAMPYLEMLDSSFSLSLCASRCQSFSVLLFSLPSSLLVGLSCCSADTHSLSFLTLIRSLRAVSVVNIDFFLVFFSPFVLDIYILYPTTGGTHTRPRGILWIDSCWKLSSLRFTARSRGPLSLMHS